MIESLASSAAPSTAVLPNGDGSQDGESGGKGALSQATSANLGKKCQSGVESEHEHCSGDSTEDMNNQPPV
ncbi:hypothetical protein GGQ12_002234 [Salinibacter ruber]|nr:hypothetical protein [Salinibacter ruber]